MKILAIETATAVCGSAVVENERILGERSIEAPQMHSEKIMGLIDEVLTSARIGLKDIDAIAVSIGPGSFTGLRIGLSVAKGLSFTCEKPLTAVSTLRALARNAIGRGLAAGRDLILCSIDARRDEVYAAGYRAAALDEVLSPRAVSVPVLAQLLEGEKRIVLVGDGAEKIQEYVMKSENSNRCILPAREHRLCSASAVAFLGLQQLQRGERSDLASLEPKYLKEFYTTMKLLPEVHR